MSLFSDNLKQERELAQISRQDMAALLNLTVQAYGHYERGDREPNVDTLRAIAGVLHVSIDSLIGNGAARTMPPVERWTRYLENMGYEVKKNGEAVEVYFHDPEKAGAKNDMKHPARFDNESDFVNMLSSAEKNFKDKEERRKEEAIFGMLDVLAALTN